MSRVHGRRSSGGKTHGGMASITQRNQSVIQRQWGSGSVGTAHRDSKQWLPPVKRAEGKELQYYDHNEGRLKVAYKEGVYESKTEKLVPSAILSDYRAGKLKRELLPLRLFQAGIASHPRQFKGNLDGAERALIQYVSSGDNTRKAGFSTLPPKKKKPIVEEFSKPSIRRLTMIGGGKKFAQESSPQAQHGNGIEKPGTDDDVQLEVSEQKKRYEGGNNIGPKNGIVKDREFASKPNRESASGYTPEALNVQAKVRHQLFNMSEEQKEILRAKLIGCNSSMQLDDREFKRTFS